MNKVTIPTIQELRNKHYKVRVTHFRKTSKNSDYYSMKDLRESGAESWIESKGGKVEVQIRSPEGVETTGIAVCSDKDIYNKSEGRARAVARALGIKDGASRFKVGDEAWFICNRELKLKKGLISEVFNFSGFDRKYQCIINNNVYTVSNNNDWTLSIEEESICETREELLMKLSATEEETGQEG